MSSSDHKRPQRVAELIKHELAEVITNELKDPRVGFVTVTEVRLGADLKSARVFVSIYGDDETRQASLAGLKIAAGYLKHVIGQRLALRRVPELRFEHDDTLDHAERLDAVMRAIAKGEHEVPSATAKPPASVSIYRGELAEKRRDAERRRAQGARRPHQRRSKR